MLKTVAVSLTTAAIGGLSFIAYQNPASYRRVSLWLFSASVVVFALANLWSALILGLEVHLLTKLKIEARDEARAAMEQLNPPTGLITLVLLAFNLVVFVLRFIPNAKSP